MTTVAQTHHEGTGETDVRVYGLPLRLWAYVTKWQKKKLSRDAFNMNAFMCAHLYNLFFNIPSGVVQWIFLFSWLLTCICDQ